MKSRRYTIVIADRATGVVRRLTISLRPTITVVVALFSLPVLVGLGARWSALAEVGGLRQSVATLKLENDSFRTMTSELTGQIQSVQAAVADLSERAPLDPDSARALAKLPPAVKMRAMGGGSTDTPVARTLLAPSLASPEDTFGALREVLGRLGSRLQLVQGDVERRTALLNATPSIWPAFGALSSTFGQREDPLHGGAAYHTGIDIAGQRGQPVFATADGSVASVAYMGDYGNMIVVDHGFGLTTRYAHLHTFGVRVGDRVSRGQSIGTMGATGRTSGTHLHYELLINGQLTNPLRMLTSVHRP